jgi:excisionase family DNA binding protein
VWERRRKPESGDTRQNIEEFPVNEPLDEPHVVLSGAVCHWLAPVLARLVRRDRPTNSERLAGAVAIGHCAKAYRALVLLRMREDRELSDGWLTTKQAAQLVGVTQRAIQQRAHRGKVAFVRQGRRLLIDPASLAN